MSKGTMDELIGMGIPQEKLCFISPAHDNVMQPRRYVIGITSKVQPTGSKREDIVLNLARALDPQLFEFVIMGSGWEDIIQKMKKRGMQVTYYDQFDYKTYVKIMPTFDYYVYPGQDEGSMGFIDALAAGVKTVVTPQGFHLDAPGGITHAFNTEEDLLQIFNTISNDRKQLLEAIATWTWKDHAVKHYEVWKYLLDPAFNTSPYSDGLNSLLRKEPAAINGRALKKSLYKGTFRRMSYVSLSWIKKLSNPSLVLKKIKARLNGDGNRPG
jgi:hypothetical protein